MVNRRRDVGSELRAARIAAGLSLRDVAKASRQALSPAALSMIEQGQRNPTLRTLAVLAHVLRLEVVVAPGGVTVTRLQEER